MSRARDLADRVLHNRTHEDTEGGRESIVTFKGEQSGGEISTLAQIQASHDGTADDQKSDLIFKTNDGSDGTSPTTAMIINSDQNVGIGGSPVPSSTGYNRAALHLQQPVTSSGSQIKFSNGTSGHTATDGGHISYWSDKNFYYNNLENSGRHRFYATNSSGTSAERVSIDSDGLKFNGDTAEANALNDYERGLHTISINQGGIGFHSLYQNFQYIKIGDFVNVHGLCLVTSSGDSNDLRINMPFTAKSGLSQTADATHGLVSSYNAPTGTGGMRCTISKGTSQLRFLKTVDNGVWTSLLGNELANNDHLYINITYEVA